MTSWWWWLYLIITSSIVPGIDKVPTEHSCECFHKFLAITCWLPASLNCNPLNSSQFAFSPERSSRRYNLLLTVPGSWYIKVCFLEVSVGWDSANCFTSWNNRILCKRPPVPSMLGETSLLTSCAVENKMWLRPQVEWRLYSGKLTILTCRLAFREAMIY